MEREITSDYLGDRHLNVLMVEDSEDDAYLLYSELAARGAKVEYRRVDSPEEMAAALEGWDWDVIICDHQMPGFDSFAALEVLKRTEKDIPFIIYSGQISDHAGHEAMNAGVHDFIPKGNFARLMPVLERELKGAAARDAARQANHRIKRLAFYDFVSSLPNHNLFRTRVNDWLTARTASGKEARGALFYIDIDRFLRINSSFGYEAGNEILRQAAQRLAECADEQAIVARLGGDEFGIFCPQLAQRRAIEVYGQWVLQTFDAPFMKGSLELYLTPSIGIAAAPEDGADAYELMMSAETAMTVARRAGGNCARFYSRDMNESSADRLALEMDMRHAVERGQLLLHFQPIVQARTGRVASVEALLRWCHPEQGLIAPERFIPIADESGLIVDIGEWALREACRQGHAWNEQGFGELHVSVNVSAVQFGQPRLLELVKQVLLETGFASECLELEITESVLMRDAEGTIGMLRALKNLGVRISADDFGTGYSSLAYLKRFPIDILKIDRTFVRDLCVNEDDAAIVRAIMALAKSMRLATVAEGVESETQVEFLKRCECDRFQGYYFSRPIDAQALSGQLATAQWEEVCKRQPTDYRDATA